MAALDARSHQGLERHANLHQIGIRRRELGEIAVEHDQAVVAVEQGECDRQGFDGIGQQRVRRLRLALQRLLALEAPFQSGQLGKQLRLAHAGSIGLRMRHRRSPSGLVRQRHPLPRTATLLALAFEEIERLFAKALNVDPLALADDEIVLEQVVHIVAQGDLHRL